MKFTLPELPPSVNALYANARPGSGGKGRFKTKRYKAWIEHCSLTLNHVSANMNCIADQVRVEYAFKRPDKRRRDVANLEKAVSDLMVSCGVLCDDSQIVDIRLYWAEIDNPVEILITTL